MGARPWARMKLGLLPHHARRSLEDVRGKLEIFLSQRDLVGLQGQEMRARKAWCKPLTQEMSSRRRKIGVLPTTAR